MRTIIQLVLLLLVLFGPALVRADDDEGGGEEADPPEVAIGERRRAPGGVPARAQRGLRVGSATRNGLGPGGQSPFATASLPRKTTKLWPP